MISIDLSSIEGKPCFKWGLLHTCVAWRGWASTTTSSSWWHHTGLPADWYCQKSWMFMNASVFESISIYIYIYLQIWVIIYIGSKIHMYWSIHLYIMGLHGQIYGYCFEWFLHRNSNPSVHHFAHPFFGCGDVWNLTVFRKTNPRTYITSLWHKLLGIIWYLI